MLLGSNKMDMNEVDQEYVLIFIFCDKYFIVILNTFPALPSIQLRLLYHSN